MIKKIVAAATRRIWMMGAMRRILTISATGLVVITVMDGCRSPSPPSSPAPGDVYQKNQSHAGVPDGNITQGKALAAKYCASCHQLPSPGLLDAGTWEKGVLPQMGPRLGIFEYKYQRYPNNSQDPNVGRGYYPSSPLLSPEEWGAVIDYYTALAPDSLPRQQRKEPLRADSTDFEVMAPDVRDKTPPATCLIRYDAATRQVLTSDILRHSFDRWDARGIAGGRRGDGWETGGVMCGGGAVGRLRTSVDISGAIVDLVSDKGGYTACNIGAFAPNNAMAGHLDRLTREERRFVPGDTPVYNGLMRPVNLVGADLNGDGRQDWVVCEFGFIKGELSWLENKGDGRYEKHVLRAVPGAIRAVVQDYNHDGLPDLWVLFAQGDEGILLFTNKGNGQFAEQRILTFPPCYGSTYFELDDFNRDGHPDILYTCGDNGDFSTVLKPYHGIYIFQNDGHEHFTRQYFFPMNGCYRAMARDFDGDGDLDIACIAYFADYRSQPDEGFVYLESKGNGQFSPHTVAAARCGRWITMDVADIDGDGKPDILLANCSVGPGFIKPATDWKKGPPFIVLRNQIR
jgi:mono/diheme cytochrome c family protein